MFIVFKARHYYLPAAIAVFIVLSFLFAPHFDASQNSSDKTNAPEELAKKTSQTDSDVIPVHPVACKPSLGFDNYRTEKSFAINPENPNEMYVAVEYKGLYKSADGGKTWNFSGNGLKAWPREDDPELPCYGLHFYLHFDPANPARILLPGGSAPGKISELRFQTGGLHESTDGGKSWHQLFNGDMNAYTTETVVDPRNPEIIYVGTAALPQSNTEADPNVIFVTKGVVYKTVDRGRTWKELVTGLIPQLRTSGLFMDPADSNHLLLATIALRVGTDAGKKVSPEQWGIMQTKNGGDTWARLESTAGIAVRFIDVSSTNFSHIFISGDLSGSDKAIYSLDGGETFNDLRTQVNFAKYDPHDQTGMRLLGFSVYAQPDDIYESLDGGKTWNAIGKLPSEVTDDYRVSNIVWDPKDKGVVYLNGDMGRVWKSADRGKTWDLLLSVEKLD